jgi:hypothetical protein
MNSTMKQPDILLSVGGRKPGIFLVDLPSPQSAMARYMLGLNALGGFYSTKFSENSEENIILASSLGLMDRTLGSSGIGSQFVRRNSNPFYRHDVIAFHTTFSGWRGKHSWDTSSEGEYRRAGSFILSTLRWALDE